MNWGRRSLTGGAAHPLLSRKGVDEDTVLPPTE